MSDVRDRIKEILSDREENDPKVLADIVLNYLKLHEKDTLLRELLPGFITNLIGGERRTLMQRLPTQRDSSTEPPVRSAGTANSGRSTKVAAIRSWYSEFLDIRCAVGGEWKRMGTLTPPELTAMASERRGMAAANITSAEQFERIADELRRRKLKVVSELPEADLQAIL